MTGREVVGRERVTTGNSVINVEIKTEIEAQISFKLDNNATMNTATTTSASCSTRSTQIEINMWIHSWIHSFKHGVHDDGTTVDSDNRQSNRIEKKTPPRPAEIFVLTHIQALIDLCVCGCSVLANTTSINVINNFTDSRVISLWANTHKNVVLTVSNNNNNYSDNHIRELEVHAIQNFGFSELIIIQTNICMCVCTMYLVSWICIVQPTKW